MGWGGAGQDRRGRQTKRDQGGGRQRVRVILFVLCNNTQGGPGRARAGQDVTGRTWAGTATRDNNEGQGRGAGVREEEGDGWARVLRGGGGGEQGKQGTGWPEERSGGLNGWPVAVWQTRRTRE